MAKCKYCKKIDCCPVLLACPYCKVDNEYCARPSKTIQGVYKSVNEESECWKCKKKFVIIKGICHKPKVNQSHNNKKNKSNEVSLNSPHS